MGPFMHTAGAIKNQMTTPGVGNFFYLKAEYVYFCEGATRSRSQEISAVHS